MTTLKERLNSVSCAVAENILRRKGMSAKGAEVMALKHCVLKDDLKRHLYFALYECNRKYIRG